MKNKGIIINGEWLGERVVTDGLFHAVCNISPIIMREFIKVINKIDMTDNAVRISKFEFPDRNSIDIEFTGDNISGLASLYFKLNEGYPELVKRKVVLYNLDGETSEVIKDNLKPEESIPLGGSFVNGNTVINTASFANNIPTSQTNVAGATADANSFPVAGMPTEQVSQSQNLMNYSQAQPIPQYMQNQQEGINNFADNTYFANSIEQPFVGLQKNEFGKFGSQFNGDNIGKKYEEGYNPANIPNEFMNSPGFGGMNGNPDFSNGNQMNPVMGMPINEFGNPNSMYMPSASGSGAPTNFNYTQGPNGGSEGNLASQIVEELYKKIQNLSFSPFQQNIQTPNGMAPTSAQGGMPSQQMMNQQKGYYDSENPLPKKDSMQGSAVNGYSNKPKKNKFNSQRDDDSYINGSNTDFSRKEHSQNRPKSITPGKEESQENFDIVPKGTKNEDLTATNSEIQYNEILETRTQENKTQESPKKHEVQASKNSTQEKSIMEMQEELSNLNSIKENKLMTIEEFLENQKESKAETNYTTFRIVDSKGSSVNANLLDDGFFVAGNKIYRWGDTLHLDE